MKTELERLQETCAASELIFDGRVVHLYVDTVDLANGGQSVREYIKHLGAVAVLPLTDAREVVCVRQYRYAVGSVLTEIPAGKLDYAGEDRPTAALRELREETGARCESLTSLGLYLGSPALLDEKIDLYLAEGLTFGEQDLDADECLDVVRIPLSDLVDAALRGELPDGKTQLAVLKVWELLRRRDAEKEAHV